MSLESAAKNKKGCRIALFCLSLTLGLGLLILSLSLPCIVGASGPEEGSIQGNGPVIGLASNALECLAVGNDQQCPASGVVRLTWPGQAERARLILTVSGVEAAHTIKVNGQPVASAPIYPNGQPSGSGETFYLDIPPEALVQGNNLIEITNDALPDDSWSATQVRLEVLGHFTVSLMDGIDNTGHIGVGDVAATDVTSYTITFTNPYDESSQEARVVIPDSYNSDTPVPLVIYVHGRSSDMYEGENTLGEATGDKGWLLATPQLHGSWTGDPQPDPPGKYAYASLESQYDIIGAMNYMLDHYNVITNQIYLVGYSMGGQIATVTIAKFPHIFAAIFDNKGPTNMVQWYDENTSYHQQWMRRECHINEEEQDPTQNPFCYQRRSSVNFASNYIHIPISITHSVSDTPVPIHHSRDFRDAINSYNPDQLASVYEDTVVGPTCGEPYHCYEPDPMAVLNFLEPFTLNNNPTYINVTTDESKSYYWLNIVQTGGDHWSRVEAAYYPISATVTATISDTQPLTVAFNLGSTALGLTRITDKLKQPGMGLPATTYLVKGGSNNYLYSYTSGYLTTTLASIGQFTLSISAIEVEVLANPAMVSGWQTATSTITTVVRDHLRNPIPDGTIIQLSTTEGTFPNGGSTYTTTATRGLVTTTLTLGPSEPTADLAEIAVGVESVTGSTSIEIIHPSLDVTVTPSEMIIYRGQVVTYTYQITNTGDITLTNVTLADDKGTPGDSGDDLTVCAGITLAARAATSCSRSATPTQTTTSIATTTGQDPLGNNVTDSDSTTISVISPAIKVAITPDKTTIYEGEVVTYTYQITNTGDITLTNVTLVDDNGTPGNSGDDLTVCTDITLAAEATTSCSRSTTLNQDTTNTATAGGQDPLGNDVTDSDSITVIVQPSEEYPVNIYLPLIIKK